MHIEYGAEVIDKNGKVLGTVSHLVRNTWTGEISKFVRDLFFSTEDVLEATNTVIRVNISFDELSEDA